jgi:hypothetical protein
VTLFDKVNGVPFMRGGSSAIAFKAGTTVTSVMTPFSSIYDTLLTGKSEVDSTDETRSPGQLEMLLTLPKGAQDTRVHVFAGCGDNGRLGTLIYVPTLRIGPTIVAPDVYSQDLPPFDVALEVRIIHVNGAPSFKGTQKFLFQHAPIGVNASGSFPNKSVDNMVFRTTGLTTAELRMLGYRIADGQAVNILAASHTVEMDLTGIRAAPEILVINYLATAGIKRTAYDVPGVLITPTAIGGYQVGSAIQYTIACWDRAKFVQDYYDIDIGRQLMVGVPASLYAYPTNLAPVVLSGVTYGIIVPQNSYGAETLLS